MSNMVQQKLSYLILFLLLVFASGFAIFSTMQKQAAENRSAELQTQSEVLQGQVAEFKKKVDDLDRQVADARRDKEQTTRDRDDLQRRLTEAQSDARRAQDSLKDFERNKKDWEQRLVDLRKERDDFAEKLKNTPERIVEKIVEKIVPGPIQPRSEEGGSSASIVVENNANEDYWAGVMREKASLELQLGELKQKVSEADMKVEEIKKANSDLEIELGRMKNEREEILRKIKYGEDLADNLSVELARARNEYKVTQDRADKVGSENQELRSEIKQLTSTKVALEKSIARLTDDKNTIEKKLVETESIIQSRIDEIWQIKKDVDTRFDNRAASTGSVELAPIVVNANVEPTVAPVPDVRKVGAVVSVNEPNNFAILNLGEKDNVRVGDAYKVYRDGKPIGTVSVIQVRKDISAADIKQKTVPFKAGDQVR